MKKKLNRVVRLLFFATVLLIALIFSLKLAQFVETDTVARELVSQFGYLGITVLALVAGVNVILPVPAATFTPVFIAAGLSMPLIILALVVGTTIADMIGYAIGRLGRDFSKDHYPETYRYLNELNLNHHHLVLPGVFLYAALAPLPNELIIIPLALIGYKLRIFIIPLILGTCVNQAILALGAANIFSFFF